jgi:hypothetical protein
LINLIEQVSDPARKLFDPTISLGTLISILVFVLTLWRLHTANVERFVKLETKVDLMWRTFKRRFGVSAEDEET